MPSHRSLRSAAASGAASTASNASRHLASRLQSGAASCASNSSRHHTDDSSGSLRQLCQAENVEAGDSRARVVAWLDSAVFDAPPIEAGSTQMPPRAQAVSKKGPLQRLKMEILMSEPDLGRSRSETPVRVNSQDDTAPIGQRKMHLLHAASISTQTPPRMQAVSKEGPLQRLGQEISMSEPDSIDRVPSDGSSLSYASSRAQTLFCLHANAFVTAVQSILVMIITAIAGLCSLLGLAKSDSDPSQSVQAHCEERKRETERDASNPPGWDAATALFEQRRARMLALNGRLCKPQIVETGRRVQSKRSMSSVEKQMSVSC